MQCDKIKDNNINLIFNFRGDKMKNVIKVLGATLMGFAIGINSYAAVDCVQEEQTNWKIERPVVSLDNSYVQNLINTDIQRYYDKMREDFEKGTFYTCRGRYSVSYEDDNLLSMVLILYEYPYGGNGAHSRAVGLIYDKNTGERIPLSNYVRATAADLSFYYRSHTYSWSKKQTLPAEAVDSSRISEVPDNYFLPGDGSVCILFRPYSLAAGCFGITYIKIEPEYIEYLNRKNKY